ncbi:MAG: hypothetical protein HY927_08675 [Elusimicrobia bacterium]|nr:hypothetical protein [Elusimicrobiota bacterium]
MRHFPALVVAGVLPLFAAGTARAQAQAQHGSYNLQPTAVTGSTRYTGLAGAVAAYPDDYSAVFVNPAGLGGMAGTGFDFGSDSNNIDNFVVDTDAPGNRALNDPISFTFYGLRYISRDGWGVGAAYQEPYKIDGVYQGGRRVRFKSGFRIAPTADVIDLEVKHKVYTVAGGVSFLDGRLAAGLALNYGQVKESFVFTPSSPANPPAELEGTEDAFSADAGLLARPWSWLQAGLVYKMRQDFRFSDSKYALPPAFRAPVRTARVPDRATAGLAWLPHRRFRLAVQSTFNRKMGDAYIVGSVLGPGGAALVDSVAAGQHGTFDGRWGAEYVPFDASDLTVKLWAGGYYEDTGIQGGYRRYHKTAGFNVAPWFLSLSMAVDDSELYNNFSVGLGVDVLQAATRAAKALGWRLPL